MKKVIISFAALFVIALLSGCGTGGAFQSSHVTSVELSGANFTIVAKDVQGTSMKGYLLGIGFSSGADVGIFAFIRIAGTDKIYDDAIKNLWANYKEKHGDIEGKNLALINIRQDTDFLNTIVYTQVNYFITADIIEFTD